MKKILLPVKAQLILEYYQAGKIFHLSKMQGTIF